jgi:hypothetical protein
VEQFMVSVVEADGRATSVSVPVRRVLLAGYTGRDRAKVLEHIHELEELGVAPPERVPMVYVVGPELLTTEPRVAVSGPETAGEVEFYLVPTADGLLVGVGSDHTDRKHEAIDVAASKALCPKIASREAWRYDDVRDHWDRIEIRSWVTDDTGRRLYQDGHLDAFMTVEDVLEEVRRAGRPDLEGHVVFGGTLPTTGGFVYGRRFETELHDPVLGRRLTCAYDVVLPTA